jgi:2-methylisocitrate lyase-like PEP mutase family enzyme
MKVEFVQPHLRRERFAALMRAGEPLVVPGAHDVLSARIAQAAGFEVVIVSGFGLAASALGVPDMELYTRDDNVRMVRNAVMVTSCPILADADDGYGGALNVMRTVREFELAGATSITLEDQVFPKRCPLIRNREELLPVEQATAKIAAAVAARMDPNMKIIARVDSGDAEQVLERARAYARGGADMIKLIYSGAGSIEFVQRVREHAGLPLVISNVSGAIREPGSLAKLRGAVAIVTHPLMSVMSTAAALKANYAALREGAQPGEYPVEPMTTTDFKAVVDTAMYDEHLAYFNK